VRVSYEDVKKAVDELGKQGAGRDIRIYLIGTKLEMTILDDYGHEVTACIHDVEYALKPTLTTKDYL